jgi:hypothetical protein
MRNLGIQSETEWRNYLKTTEIDPSIPKRPDNAYKNNGWVGWSDVFDRPKRRNKDFLDFGELLNLLESKNIRNSKGYRQFYQNCSNEIKSRIPFDLKSVFKKNGLKGWADFLGKEKKE